MTELVRGLGISLGWCHKFIYKTLTIYKHACKTVCDVNPGIDPGPSEARLYQGYQISATFCYFFKPLKVSETEKFGRFFLCVFQSFALAEKKFGVRCTLKCAKVWSFILCSNSCLVCRNSQPPLSLLSLFRHSKWKLNCVWTSNIALFYFAYYTKTSLSRK